MQTTSTTTPRKPIALVLGASGRFGAAAVQAFAAAGWAVLAQARRKPDALPPGATHVAVDMADAAALAAAAAGARVVVYGVNPLYTQWPALAMPLLRQGIEVAQRLNAVFMLPGNVYNFGAQMPPLLDERTPQQPTTRKGRIRVDMEAELQALARQGRLRSIVIRAGDFFGGGSGSWMDLVITKSLRQGKLVYPGPQHLAHAWAYQPDLARAFAAAASRADALPAFADLPFAGHTLAGTELLDAIERAAVSLGVAPKDGRFKRGGVPWLLMKVGGLVVPMLREIAEMSYLWHTPHGLDGSALARAVGPLSTTPIDGAMRDALIALGFAKHARCGSQPASA
ncbi:MAG TPA: NAD-dependent epimerase/dehydratase family protein [Burkholderiaceae bacterium]|nr:NAD-dependent epimerase/dehydratase family protein [Burkholderiaceae bacterium]